MVPRDRESFAFSNEFFDIENGLFFEQLDSNVTVAVYGLNGLKEGLALYKSVFVKLKDVLYKL